LGSHQDFPIIELLAFPQNVLLTAKTAEKIIFSKKVFIVMEKISQIFLKIKPLKSRDQNDSEHVHNF